MEESFLPWWLMLLLGMWAVAVALWQSPSVHREVRLWSGLATLVYLGLIFLALKNDARSTGSQPPGTWRNGLVALGSFACMAASLTASVWLLGRALPRSRRVSYLVLTFANAGVCVLMNASDFAVALTIIALISGRPFRDLIQPFAATRTLRDRFKGILQFDERPMGQEDVGRFWLTCGISGVVACVLIGTVGYSLRVETSRSVRSPRNSALPSRERIELRTADSNHSVHVPTVMEFAFGARADVVVLLAVIVFLGLAIAMNDLSGDSVSQMASIDFPDSQPQPEEFV